MKIWKQPYVRKLVRFWLISFALWNAWWSGILFCGVARLNLGIGFPLSLFSVSNLSIAGCLILFILFASTCFVFGVERKRAFLWITVSLIYFLSFYPWLRFSEDYERHMFRRVSENAAPLISAIESYVEEHDGPPDRLQDLVPQYLAAIPATGVSPRNFGYFTGKDGLGELYGNRWMLEIEIATGGLLEQDLLTYLPNRNYGELEDRPNNERVGEWYYHIHVY